MTREEILAMETDGLKLRISSAVAIHVMGWHRHSETKEWIDDDGNVEAHWRWSPEIDISAAWQVVEAMRKMEDGEGNPLLCCLTIYSDHDLAWDIRWCYSELSNRDDGHKTHRLPTCYDEFPEAISKAALLAKLERR